MKTFIKEIRQFWVDTWQTSKLLFFVELICTLLGMTAATMLNFGAIDPDMFTVLILYTISAIGLAATSYYRKTPMMILLMAFYTIVGFIGIFTLITG